MRHRALYHTGTSESLQMACRTVDVSRAQLVTGQQPVLFEVAGFQLFPAMGGFVPLGCRSKYRLFSYLS